MKKPLIVVGLVLLALVALKLALSTESADDRTLIVEALRSSIQASKEGRPGGASELLSSHLKLNDQEVSASGHEIAKYIRDQRPDIVVENQNPMVNGDEARIISPVDMTIHVLTVSQAVHFKQVTLVFRREDDRKWLVVPVKRWKLADVLVSEDPFSALSP